MARLFAKISLFCIVGLLCATKFALASEYHGEVVFGGEPLPGATVTATQGEKKVAAVTDASGVYSFADLADGQRPAIPVHRDALSYYRFAEITPQNVYEMGWLC